jgi:hypothetical protein
MREALLEAGAATGQGGTRRRRGPRARRIELELSDACGCRTGRCGRGNPWGNGDCCDQSTLIAAVRDGGGALPKRKTELHRI